MGGRRLKSRTHWPVCTSLGPNRPQSPARLRCGGGSPCSRHRAPAGQLHPNVLCQLWALAEQRANRIRRRSRLGADDPGVRGADAIGDCVVPQSRRAACILAVVHGNISDLDCLAEV
eukprot:scaffold82221_cov66-Phaeocystis_antarctica.AAC.3